MGYIQGIPREKAERIVRANNFHSRAVTIVSFSTDEHYRYSFSPFTPSFKAVPFGDARALGYFAGRCLTLLSIVL